MDIFFDDTIQYSRIICVAMLKQSRRYQLAYCPYDTVYVFYGVVWTACRD